LIFISRGNLLVHMALVVVILVSAHGEFGVVSTIVTVYMQFVGLVRFSDCNLNVAQLVRVYFFAHLYRLFGRKKFSEIYAFVFKALITDF